MSGLNLEALQFWREVLLANVKRQGPDLSNRQMALLLSVYLLPRQHTIKSLSDGLHISKAATSRAVSSLTLLGFVKRARDEKDRRVIYIQRTVKGSVFLSEFSHAITRASKKIGK